MFLYYVKQMVCRVLLPVPLGLELVAAGILLVAFTKRRRLGLSLLVTGTGLLFLLGYPAVSRPFLRSLEGKYPPLYGVCIAGTVAKFAEHPPVIMVLGTGFESGAVTLPANSRFDPAFVLRLFEAVRLQRLFPDARVYASIPGLGGTAEKRAVLDEFCVAAGVSPGRFFLIDKAYDTQGEAGLLAAAVTERHDIILVTSAAHMPRAVHIFRHHGFEPLPAPCAYRAIPCTPDKFEFTPTALFPSANSLFSAETVSYEYLGLLFEYAKDLLHISGTGTVRP